MRITCHKLVPYLKLKNRSEQEAPKSVLQRSEGALLAIHCKYYP